MGYSNLASKFIKAHENNYTKNRKAWGSDKISEICIHYMAGNCSIETLGNIWQNPLRKGSSNYGIGSDGRIGCYVDENDIAWCNSNWASNCRSASIEVANLSPSDSTVTDYALNSLIKLVADIAKRNNIGKLVKGKNVTWHSMYVSTSCPGSYLLNKMDYIVNEANKIITGEKANLPISEPDQVLQVGSKVMINGVFKIDEVIKPNSKYKNGAIGSYDMCYGKPIGNSDWIPCGPLGECKPELDRADYNSSDIAVGEYFICDKIFTVKKVEPPTSFAKNGVAVLDADGVEFRTDCGPLIEIKD